ncbi:hypothetical protein [Bradyrhizobium acaciae]|uniref:hypothetical protein n=1 Tax=Bradyrhizobium acaciae TaxID=2683706 RepID=UPI001E359BC8|nr:hypothetical protein [Bradyrhizobium acaciae]MCC8984205.1 hypothetical protein [Bradyrhizobium acaciae]
MTISMVMYGKRSDTDQLSAGRTKQRMPASGVKQTTARFVGLSVLSMILFGGTRSQNGFDIFQRASIKTS